ncbi:MAG: Lrp/AsnC family transcriptional regulator [Opitutae bacterium]|jgi:DNA-binding Lrp family transcriptional regulator|nr:Lrp/AsnC family transcriptional regulator [Verrucomicrobiota bacterium]MDA0905665.1 Lrp/AsnC family transcriptional regulator [Verrucomicrobiota bacterium]MDA1079045.1 Lrp/AsnC family transcriptional regulator [Verrucomicrobiota bacterium]NDH00578.1 Lrp/AsnC family transcriptional regulator [Opitutae bacterium]
MSELLSIIQETADPNPESLSKILGLSIAEVETQIRTLRKSGVLLGWVPLINPSKTEGGDVRSVIEVKISPERDGGFDRLAHRISMFEEVEACHLMSGAYDLLVIVKGKNLHAVASFVSERLSTIDGVLSTSTHFLLRSYKEHGHLLSQDGDHSEKPPVSA